MAKQQLLSNMFTIIDKEEMEDRVERDFAQLHVKMELEQSKKKEVQKRPVGRPKMRIEAVLLPTKEEKPKATPSTTKARGPYTNWFVPSLWDPIYSAVSHHRSLGHALRYLQVKYKLPGQNKSVYDKLTRGSLREWFTKTGELKEGTKQAIFKETAVFTGGAQHSYVLSKHHELEEEIITLLKAHREAGQPLFATSVRTLIRTLIQKREPHLLDFQSPNGFRVSLEWTRDFVRTKLDWSFRKSTGAARKLPADWEQQGLNMAHRTAYLVKAHSIPPELVVNTDQTGIHLVPTGGTRTWAEKGSKHVQVLGMEDKRQITATLSSSATGQLLPLQIVFTGSTERSLPPRNAGRLMCEEAGWHLTFSANHWSNLTTCKQFVEAVLQPYRRKQVQAMGLDSNSKLVWILDCWSVHISQEFMSWLKVTHVEILLIFVPANCTSIFQPADVILQRPFKHGFRQQFDQYTSETLGQQIDEKELQDVKLDTKISVLKPLICGWLWHAWQHINKPSMIQKGWSMCGLDQAFEPTFQTSAMEEHMKSSLFKEVVDAEQDFREKEDDTDPDLSVELVMERNLCNVANVTAENRRSTVANMKDQARKRYVQSFIHLKLISDLNS